MLALVRQHKRHEQQNRNYLESIPFEACPDFEVAYAESEDVVCYTGKCVSF